MYFRGRKVVEVGTYSSQCSECGENYLSGFYCKGCGVAFEGAILTYTGIPYTKDHFNGLPILEGWK
jgi:hypothetical protein